VETALLVAAGGGGDALGALIVGKALGRLGVRPVVLSFSWDRYLIDPTPGPRTHTDFSDLTRLTEHTWEVTAASRLRTGGVSGLTLLARHTDARFALLDPSAGAVGLSQQIRELAQHLAADRIMLVDVGGDIVARGDEDTLLSPVADFLALAAVAAADLPAELVVAGPGLDGELPEPYVRARIGATSYRLAPSDVTAYLPALDHHPSEATTLLAAAALGVTGHAQIRGSGAVVPLGPAGADVLTTDFAAVAKANTTVENLLTTRTFQDAEDTVRRSCGRNELDQERRKAARLDSQPETPDPSTDELRQRFTTYAAGAAGQGISLVSFRRLAEVLGRRRYDPDLVRRVVGPLAHRSLPLVRLA